MSSDTSPLSEDAALIQAIPAVPVILDVLCRTTGMGFAAVACVTESQWVACSVLDRIQFGLKPGDELEPETAIRHEIREHRTPVIIGGMEGDDRSRHHRTSLKHGFRSYISVPIFLSGIATPFHPHPAPGRETLYPPKPPQPLDISTLKELFIRQCAGMDPRRDTFASVLEKAGEAGGDPHPRLKPREAATLHGFYLRALSDALGRETRARVIPRELLRRHGDGAAA